MISLQALCDEKIYLHKINRSVLPFFLKEEMTFGKACQQRNINLICKFIEKDNIFKNKLSYLKILDLIFILRKKLKSKSRINLIFSELFKTKNVDIWFLKYFVSENNINLQLPPGIINENILKDISINNTDFLEYLLNLNVLNEEYKNNEYIT
jgi:hypothetical protein